LSLSQSVLGAVVVGQAANADESSVIANEAERALPMNVRTFQCGFCEFIIFSIYGYLSENSTEKTIIQTVDGICNYIPANYENLVSVCSLKMRNGFFFLLFFLFRHTRFFMICHIDTSITFMCVCA
jgi:hypothetical protein